MRNIMGSEKKQVSINTKTWLFIRTKNMLKMICAFISHKHECQRIEAIFLLDIKKVEIIWILKVLLYYW